MANNPYVNKVVFGGQTVIDLSTDTVTSSDDILLGKVGHLRDGSVVTGTASGGDQHGTIWQDGEGYVHLDDESGIALQSKTATPTESQQVIEADQGYYALDKVTVGAISSSYVGSGVSRRSSSDLTVSGATVTAPAGYYASSASKAVASSAGTVIHLHGTGSSTYAYVKLNGTKYYQEADIPFTVGDELYIYATPPDYGANIYVDYVNVASNPTASAEYTYLLKNFSIDVELSASRFASSITVLTPLAEADKITVTGSFTTNSGGGTQSIPHWFNDGGKRYLASLRIWLGDMNNVPSEIPTGTNLIVSETLFKTYPEVAPAYTGTGDKDKLYGCSKAINSSGSTYNKTGGLYKSANVSQDNVNVSSSNFYIYSVPSGSTYTSGFIAGVTYSYEITFVTNTGE